MSTLRKTANQSDQPTSLCSAAVLQRSAKMRKAISLCYILLCIPVALSATEIPVRSPKMGEARPSWWLSCWMGHVVVIEGEMRVDDDGEADVEVEVRESGAKKYLDEKDRELQRFYSQFYLASFTPNHLLFASPGITSADGRLHDIQNGSSEDIVVLVPFVSLQGHSLDRNAQGNITGVFIFRYGSVIPQVPMVFDEMIPVDGLASALRVFEHRGRFDHRKHKEQNAEQTDAANP